ncbi:uncharacterized protein B0H64DRAFT_211507 [Chaetomium fimeti]|uniref:Uncharacterized protein n=1 Tax=Chaetomium fimeti TaxID=1854472 RepID=A0AAE0HD21_9PEZI|nr:hypothetical protein B0H64DRAFT_211507 [Chaetomium fimeti]
MGSQNILATPPTPSAILDPLLERVRAFNTQPPVGLCQFNLDAEMPLLLNPPDEPVPCSEPLALFEAVNAHFSAQIHAFFHALHSLEQLAVNEPDLIRPTSGLQPEIQITNQSYDIYPDCLHRLHPSRRLTVQNADTLPLLHRVTQLRVHPETNYHCEPGLDSAHQRPLSPRVPFQLAARLPNLRALHCRWLWERLPVAFWSRALRVFARVWEGPWRDARAEFARGVRDFVPVMPAGLAKVRLWFWKPIWGTEMDEAVRMPDLVMGASSNAEEFGGVDPVSCGLRELGGWLEELDVRALVTPDLFPCSGGGGGGDGSEAGDAASSSWPRMRHLKVEFHPCAPTGSWYFSGPRGEDPFPTGFAVTKEDHYPPGREDIEETHDLWWRDEDEWDDMGKDENIFQPRRPDMFRIRPIQERVNPLLLAFASSLGRETMPSLQDAELFTWLTWLPSEERRKEYEGGVGAPGASWVPQVDGDCQVMFRWGVKYEAPKGDEKGKVTWQVGESWMPGTEIMRAFEHLLGEDRDNVEWQSFDFVEDRDSYMADYD